MSYVLRWQEAMVDHTGNMPKRMIDDGAEEAFWKTHLQKRKQTEPDPYAHDVYRGIAKLVHKEDTVLEIGPGWGNYTFSLARDVEHVTCVDSAEAIIQSLEKRAEQEGYYNMSFLHKKWEEATLVPQHDVVFGFNCYYRMFQITEALLKMNRTAKRLAIVGMNTGPEKPHYMELHRRGFTISLRKRDYIDLLNILFELGIRANCTLIPLQSTKLYGSFDEALNDNVTKIVSLDHTKLDEVADVLRSHLVEENGGYRYTYHFHAALLHWTPVKGI
ncbi:hypothetical protein A374_14070 [Fictibacillus macauensis ZFHKF-1]|uniref:Methyltransferase domain-containing protein n=1 Tax=Fictibacillus macauensis ZFHKF-1 TaxID=1196324 RepID=I8AHA8_9BACL|nr:class I SAM-dependent methyltransferase [Fictibacillus macauensis]EIT84824.1 hypothetical protein A374_14070 [Fictibacillus macauensis ZFHKF-1]